MITITHQSSCPDFVAVQTAFLLYKLRIVRTLFLVCGLFFLVVLLYEMYNSKPLDIISWGFFIYAIILIFGMKAFLKFRFKKMYNSNSKCREFYSLTIDAENIVYKAETHTSHFKTKDFIMFEAFKSCFIIWQAKKTNAIIFYKSAMENQLQEAVTSFFYKLNKNSIE